MIAKNLEIYLTNSLKNNKLHHCIMLSNNSHYKCDEEILFIINKINNSNYPKLDQELFSPNIIMIDEQNDGLKKDNIKEIFENSNLSYFDEKTYKIIIFRNIELASNSALNTLLKTIEEPSNNVIFILTTNNINQVLSTIKSRSLVININKTNQNNIFDALDIENEYKIIFNNLKVADYDAFTNQIDQWINNLEELISSLQLSVKNKYQIAHYFEIFMKNHEENEWHIQAQIFKNLLILLNQKNLINKLLVKLLENLQKHNVDIEKMFLVTSQYIDTFETNFNTHLQFQKFIIELMESYV